MPAPATAAPAAQRARRVSLVAATLAASALAVSACSAPLNPAGNISYPDSTSLAEAMNTAGVPCNNPKLVQKIDSMSMTTCENPDFVSLNIVVFADAVSLARLVKESQARDGATVSATTTIYGNNWATIGQAKDAATVEATAQKLGASLATAD